MAGDRCTGTFEGAESLLRITSDERQANENFLQCLTLVLTPSKLGLRADAALLISPTPIAHIAPINRP